MTRPRVPLIVAGILATGLLATAVTLGVQASRHSAHAPVTYYCPMHPTYTSTKPGDCPICNMRLVPRPATDTRSTTAASTKNTKPHDICYMHNCPMMHDGKPCPMLVVAKEGEPVTCPLCHQHVADRSEQGQRVVYWTDPMLPGYKADRPGKSPMGMELVPVYADPATPAVSDTPEGYATILVTPQKRQLIGVRTGVVERRALSRTIRTVGTIAHDPDLYQAQAEYIQAMRALEQARASNAPEFVEQAQRILDSTKIRLRHLGLSEAMIEEMAAWKEPEHGLLFSHPGEPVWLYAKVYEYELPLVRIGQTVTVEAPAFPGQRFHGTIRAIDPMVDPMTRTTRIRAQLEDAQGQLTPDMYVNVDIAVELGEVLAIPVDAVFDTGAQKIVFVDRGEGLFEPRNVTLGARGEGFYEVKAGVAEGERVVTSGNFLIDSESRLKAALQGMVSPSTESGPQPSGGAITPSPADTHQHGH